MTREDSGDLEKKHAPSENKRRDTQVGRRVLAVVLRVLPKITMKGQNYLLGVQRYSSHRSF